MQQPEREPWMLTIGLVFDVAVGGALTFVAGVMASRWLGITAPRVLALQALTPVWLLGAAAATVAFAARRRWWAAKLALALTAGHLAAVLPAVWPHSDPAWVADAPTITVMFSNGYHMNTNPGALLPMLEADPDVLVLAEVKDAFPALLSSSDVPARYPYQLRERKGRETETIILSKLPFTATRWGPGSEALPIATVEVGGTPVTIVGVHPPAPIDPGQAAEWRHTLNIVERIASQRGGEALVFLGDFNATRWHAPFLDILDAGMVDAHESTGHGLSRSWPMGRRVPPFMRLDHALLGDGLAAVEVHDIVIPGSDHKAFEATLAVRPP